MNVTDELQRLVELHERGGLTSAEFARAKATVLGGESPEAIFAESAAPDAHLERIEWQNELARLDREWDLERENYLMSGRHGARYIPEPEKNMPGNVFLIIFLLLWTFGGGGMAAMTFFPAALIIVGFGGFCLWLTVDHLRTEVAKAAQYRQAEQHYKERRAALLQQQGEMQLDIANQNHSPSLYRQRTT